MKRLARYRDRYKQVADSDVADSPQLENPAPTEDHSAEKMSAVLRSFVDPFLERLEDFNEAAIENTILLGVLAWNIALYPEAERAAAIEKALFPMPSEVRHPVRTALREMIERKLQSFDSNQRVITKCDVTFESARGPQVSVVSSVGAASYQCSGDNK